MTAQPVMVALPGTLCSPAIFEPLARALAGEVVLDSFSWLTQPGPWDIPAIAERVSEHSQRDLDLTSQLGGLRQPAVVVHGLHDRARPPEQGRELAESLPNADLVLVDAGHTPVYETPDAVAACVRDVLKRAGEPLQGR